MLIDVETANRNRSSICQIGLVEVRQGRIGRSVGILVDPEEPFDPINVSIHGIDGETVREAEAMPRIYPGIQAVLEGAPAVSHSPFDRQALERATAKYGLTAPRTSWLDSGRIARATWPEKYGKGGWGLKQIASDLHIPFRHHDALEDAAATAQILLHAHRHSGLDVSHWLEAAGYGRPERPPEGERGEKPPWRDRRRRPPPEMSWAGSLAKIIGLEEKKGWNDRAVAGGMDRFMERWAEAICGDLGETGMHRTLLPISYAGLEPADRKLWAGQWLQMIEELEQTAAQGRT